MSSTTTAPSGTARTTPSPCGLIKDPTTQLPDGYLDRIPMFQYILLSICFPMWGAAASLNDILITQFKSVFTLSAFYGGYFLIAIPSSRIIRRTSYKTGLLIGLVVYIVGCTLFFPASHMATYSVFLAALFAIAVGLSFLETSANTYSSMIGPKRSSTLRLNISQTFTSLGFLAGAVLGKYLIFTDGEALHSRLASLTGLERQQMAEAALQRTLAPYRVIIVVLVILAVVVAITQFPHCKPLNHRHEEAKATIGETLSYLARNRRFRMGILLSLIHI